MPSRSSVPVILIPPLRVSYNTFEEIITGVAKISKFFLNYLTNYRYVLYYILLMINNFYSM